MRAELQIPAELDPAIHKLIGEACARGDRLADAEEYGLAIKAYNEAWQLIPEPKAEWNASTWVLTAIADCAYLGGFRQSAREAIDYVMTCPGAIGNPFIHLRRGQILLDEGENDAAADELARAYMGGGTEIFAGADPKYLHFLSTHMQL